jgi:hypothetical protein
MDGRGSLQVGHHDLHHRGTFQLQIELPGIGLG